MAIDQYLRRVYSGTAAQFCQGADQVLLQGGKMFIVTANPEILMHARQEPDLDRLLLGEEATVVPDGISVVKAMELCGLPVRERITGVDLAEHFLRVAGEAGKRVYLLGAREEVVSALGEKLRAQYPRMDLAWHNGYDGDKDQILREIAAREPDLVLVGLGVPAQERLIARHYGEFSKGLFMGVGGSFDVLSGSLRRAPALFVRTNTEWLYRILRQPSRLGRFWRNNVKFLGEVRRASQKGKKNKQKS